MLINFRHQPVLLMKTVHLFCEVEENNFEADWSTGLSLIGGNAETTDMFLATWLEKINRKN